MLEGSLTLTPHVNPDGTITLSLSLPSISGTAPAADRLIRLRPVSSGDPLLIRNFFPDTGRKASLASALLLQRGETLLIFITPTFAASRN